MISKIACSFFQFLTLVVLLGSSLWGQQQSLLPQVADSSTIRTTFVLFNPTGEQVTVTITITGDDGEPLALDLANLGTQSQFVIALPPGGTRILRTNGTGDGQPGAARVVATGSIGVSAIFSLFDGQGNFLTETGIGDARVSAHFKIPVDTTGDFNTGVALFNTIGQAADLQFMLFDTDGNQVATTELQLAGGGHLASFVAGPGQLFPQIDDAKGTLGIWSSQPVAALTLRQNVARLNLTSLPAVPEDSTDKEFILAHVGDGPQFGVAIKMTFLLFNLSSEQANVQIDLTADDGNPLSVTIDQTTASSFNVVLGAGAARFLETAGDGGTAATLQTGAAEIVSDQPIGVSGIFTLVDAQGNFLTETGIGTSEVLAAATVAVDTTGDTGLAFYNPGNSPEELTLRFFDSEGNPAQAAAVSGATPAQNGDPSVVTKTLLPGEHDAQFAGQIFTGVELGLGSVSITGNAAILTLRQMTNPLSFTAFPVGRGAYSGVVSPESGPALPREIDNITLTTDQVLDVMLPAGFTLSGQVNAPDDAFATVITAERSDGLSFFGIVDFFTGTYSMTVPAGTYELSSCPLIADLGGQDSGFYSLYEDPNPVVVTQDTMRAVTITAPVGHTVSGTISGLGQLPASPVPLIVSLSTAEGLVGAIGELAGNGAYQVMVPNGTFDVSVFVVLDDTTSESLGIAKIGQVTVAGGDVTGANFTIPALVTLSGDVRNADASPLSSAGVLALDGSLFDFRFSGCLPQFPGFSFVSVNSPYQLLAVPNRTYTVQAFQDVQPEAAPQSLGSLIVPFPGRQIQLTANRTGEDFVFPILPQEVMISGRVTDAQGAPLEGVDVSAFSQNLTDVNGGVAYSRGTTTDANGNYNLTVFSGVSYLMSFVPPVPDGGFPFPFP